jgi:hypothetical protein
LQKPHAQFFSKLKLLKPEGHGSGMTTGEMKKALPLYSKYICAFLFVEGREV